MKFKILTITLTFALLTVSVFGFFIFGFIAHNGQHGCFVSSIPGNNCPSVGGSIAIAFHHISGIQNLILTIASSNSSSLLFVTFFIFIFFIILKFLQKTQNLQYFSNKTCGRILESIFIQKNQFLHWLSLSRKRDPHLFL